MNLNTLQYALVLAQEGNMRNAAKRLYISQPSLSQSISRLELELGTSLFVREKGGIRPTQAGIVYLEWAEKVVRSQKNMTDTINAVKEGRASSIKIGITYYRASHLLAEILPGFLQLCPGCRILIEEYSSPMLQSLLENRTVDFCITPDAFSQIDYINIPFFQEPILLATPDSIVLPYNKTDTDGFISVQALDKIPFIILAEDLYIGRLARSLFSCLDCEPNIIMQCRTLDTALSMVQKGLGATLVPLPFHPAHMFPSLQYFRIDHPAAVRTISVIYRKEHYLTKEEGIFLKLLQDAGHYPNRISHS